MHARVIVLFVAAAGLAAVVGCAPSSGVITAASGPMVGSDITYVSLEGKQSEFNKARYPVAVVVFAAPEGPNCCWLDPKLVNIADEVLDLPVTVAQFSLPTTKCPHGPGCVETCNMRQGGLMSLCDAQRIAWKAYGQPAPGTLILIGLGNKILMKGSLSDPKAVVAEAKRLGQVEKQRRAGGERKAIY